MVQSNVFKKVFLWVYRAARVIRLVRLIRLVKVYKKVSEKKEQDDAITQIKTFPEKLVAG